MKGHSLISDLLTLREQRNVSREYRRNLVRARLRAYHEERVAKLRSAREAYVRWWTKKTES